MITVKCLHWNVFYLHKNWKNWKKLTTTFKSDQICYESVMSPPTFQLTDSLRFLWDSNPKENYLLSLSSREIRGHLYNFYSWNWYVFSVLLNNTSEGLCFVSQELYAWPICWGTCSIHYHWRFTSKTHYSSSFHFRVEWISCQTGALIWNKMFPCEQQLGENDAFMAAWGL